MIPFVWLAILIVALVIEANTIALVSLWFAFGALASLIAGLLGAEIWLQAVLFLGVSAVLLACLRPLVRKRLTPRITPTNVDSVVGTQGYVTADIDNVSAAGQVKLGAMYWTARSTSGEPITEGTLVRVDRIEGVKVFVSPAEIGATV
ncbi:MAG: NfeD family protein [Ruminococcaceae bacterium]|nr:NfeD family protein [Oscillospiraceae bacterium]